MDVANDGLFFPCGQMPAQRSTFDVVGCAILVLKRIVLYFNHINFPVKPVMGLLYAHIVVDVLHIAEVVVNAGYWVGHTVNDGRDGAVCYGGIGIGYPLPPIK